MRRNKELNSSYKELQAELRFYDKVDEKKNRGVGDAADEKRALAEEKIDLEATIEAMKRRKKKAKH